MAKTAFSQWDTTAANNTDINGTPIDKTATKASDLETIIRQMMAQLAAARTNAAAFMANTAGRLLDTDGVWAAGAEVTLTDATTIAVDMSTFINAKVTLGGNRTLGQPSNTKPGQSGAIRIIQDGAGSRTLAFHADWKFAFGADPVLSTTAGATDILFYHVAAANVIYASLAKAVA
jgi:hypothetical protein